MFYNDIKTIDITTALEARKRQQTDDITRALYDYIDQRESVSLVAAAKHLRSIIPDYDQALKKASELLSQDNDDE